MSTIAAAPSAIQKVADSDDPVLRVTGATKRYGEVAALDGVDLVVNRHEIVALLGASGCGKTTLLRAIAGLASLDGGEVVLGGRSIVGLAPQARDIAMVFQEGALFPHLTVEKNIAVGIRRGQSRGSIGPIAQLLHIESLLGRQPHELSGGQRQRVGIARALVRRPALMLMDEPFAALDADLRLELRRELRRLHQVGELAETVFVTHDQTEALGIADRIAVMSSGRILQQGTPSELLEQPVSLEVARFLGVPRICLLPESMGMVIAMRPTDLVVGDTVPANSLAVTVRVTAAEPFAGGWLVSALTPGGVEIDVATDWALKPQPGETIVVSCPIDRLHVFDAATGARRAQPIPDLQIAFTKAVG